MEDTPGEASCPSPAAAAARAAKPKLASRRDSNPQRDAEAIPEASGDVVAAAGEDPDDDDVETDVFLGRPDLTQDALEELRRRQRSLRQEQRKVRMQLKLQARKRSRVITRMRNLDTAAVLQVLMDRGIDFTGRSGSGTAEPASGRAASSGDGGKGGSGKGHDKED